MKPGRSAGRSLNFIIENHATAPISNDDTGNRYSSQALASDIKRTGFWGMVHEARAYLTMLLGCIYLAIVDAGRRSADRLAKE